MAHGDRPTFLPGAPFIFSKSLFYTWLYCIIELNMAYSQEKELEDAQVKKMPKGVGSSAAVDNKL